MKLQPDPEQAVDFLGLVSLTPLDRAAICQVMAERPASAPFAYIVTPNAQHVVQLSQPDSPLRAPYAGAWMRTCDSQVVRALARLTGGDHLALVTGSDLTLDLLRDVIKPDDPVTIIGGGADLPSVLHARFGLARIAQHIPPMGYFRQPAEVQRCVDFALAHPARFTFAITGAPASETVLMRIAQTGRATGIGLPVGSAIDFAVGRVRRAPVVMQRAGLEWLFRLGTSPRRLLRRYFVESPPILWLALRWKLGRH